MLIFTTSTATFHKFKPHKLYKHLVAPLFDLVTGSILDPVGHILSEGNGKRRKKHHHKHHHSHSEYYDEPEFIHEHEVYINHGGPLIYPGHGGHSCGGFHGGAELDNIPGYEGIPYGYPIPYLGELYHENDSDEEDVSHF